MFYMFCYFSYSIVDCTKCLSRSIQYRWFSCCFYSFFCCCCSAASSVDLVAWHQNWLYLPFCFQSELNAIFQKLKENRMINYNWYNYLFIFSQFEIWVFFMLLLFCCCFIFIRYSLPFISNINCWIVFVVFFLFPTLISEQIDIVFVFVLHCYLFGDSHCCL